MVTVAWKFDNGTNKIYYFSLSCLYNGLPWYNWKIVETGIIHHSPNPAPPYPTCWNKMKNKKYNTIGAVPKFQNRRKMQYVS